MTCEGRGKPLDVAFHSPLTIHFLQTIHLIAKIMTKTKSKQQLKKEFKQFLCEHRLYSVWNRFVTGSVLYMTANKFMDSTDPNRWINEAFLWSRDTKRGNKKWKQLNDSWQYYLKNNHA